MSMSVQSLEVAPLMANCYIVGCEQTGRGFIVDPGGDGPRIVDAVRASGLEIDYILDTHCHPDHIGANCEVREAVGGKVLIHESERDAVEHPPAEWLLIGLRPEPCEVDGAFVEGEQIEIGELRVKVMHLPGHSPGSVAFVVGDAAFVGDVLFAGSIGRTDLPGGDHQVMMASLKRIVTELPDATTVYSGHGPSSTIGEERETNDWLEGM